MMSLEDVIKIVNERPPSTFKPMSVKDMQRPEDVTLEEQVEAFKAWKRGKKSVQSWHRNSQSWIGLYQVSYIDSNTVIRRKPQPKLRPWKPEEVPVGAVIRYKHNTDNKGISLITHCNGIMVWTGFNPAIPHSLERLFEDYDMSLEPAGTAYINRTWLPCGVEE